MLRKVIFCAAIIFLSGCTLFPSEKESNSEEIIIGGIIPYKNGAPEYGEILQKTADLRIKQINQSGGINGKKISIVWKDGGCNHEIAANAAQELIKKNKVKIIIGGVCSEETIGAASISNQEKIILISPVSQDPKISEIGEFVYRTTAPTSLQDGEIIAKHATLKNYNSVGILEEYNEYTSVNSKKFIQNFNGKTTKKRFVLGTDDFRPIIQKFITDDVDAIFLNLSLPSTVQNVITELRNKNYSKNLLGNKLVINTASIMPNQNEYFDATNLCGIESRKPTTIQINNFKKAFEEEYQTEIFLPDFVASTLDAIDIIKEILLVSEDPQNTNELKEILDNIQFIGSSGTIIFDKNGEIRPQNKTINTNLKTNPRTCVLP